jgi:hypothetical protein
MYTYREQAEFLFESFEFELMDLIGYQIPESVRLYKIISSQGILHRRNTKPELLKLSEYLTLPNLVHKKATQCFNRIHS